MSEPLLELRGVNKSFGVVHVLHDVDFAVYPGEVTALVGDNGAGKSVLIKCTPAPPAFDAGSILWEGRPVHLRSPRDSAALGIETVHQDLALCDNLDIVVQHVPLVARSQDAASHARRGGHGVAWPPHPQEPRHRSRPCGRYDRRWRRLLSGGQRQSVAIAKAVLWNSKLVIMDEPTAALGVAETTMVLDLVRRLADRGLCHVLLVSHNMERRVRGRRSDRCPPPRPGRRRRARQGRDPQPGGRADHRRPLRRPRHHREPRHGERLRRDRHDDHRVRDHTSSPTAAGTSAAWPTATSPATPCSTVTFRRRRPRLPQPPRGAGTWAPCPRSSAWSCCSWSSSSLHDRFLSDLQPGEPRRAGRLHLRPRDGSRASSSCSARSTCPRA